MTEHGQQEQQNFHAVTWTSISRDASHATAQNNHQYQWVDQFHAMEQEKTGVAQAESKNPYLNKERGPTFRAIGEAQILSFAGLYECLGLSRRDCRFRKWQRDGFVSIGLRGKVEKNSGQNFRKNAAPQSGIRIDFTINYSHVKPYT